MIQRLWRNPIAVAFLAILLLVLLTSTLTVVPETKQAVIVRFGTVQRIINPFRAGQPFGSTGAGLIARAPMIDNIVWIDKRIQSIDLEQQQVLSTDQLRLQVDAYARYRIVDPLRMYISARTEENVSERLKPILGSALRNELGRRPFAALLSPERGQMMQNIKTSLDRVASQYGARIVDVRIKRADLPEGTPLESAFQRMKTARQQEAQSIRAEGRKEAQIIGAEADAQAAKTYAEAFGKDPQFYEFYRAMQSYQTTFLDNGGKQGSMGGSSIILSPNNSYLKEFMGR
jgi:modulator of FtsH protease HflC